MIGEDDDDVRPRGVAARPVDSSELLVELAERLERVGALEPRVVRDLVVAREGRVDRGPPFHHVLEHAVDDQVANEDAERRAHERVVPTAMAAWAHIATLRSARRCDLEDHLPEEEDEQAGHVEAVGEEAPVAGIRLLLRLQPADRQDHVVRLSRQEIAAARAPVDEQPVAGVAALDLLAVRRRRAGHHRRRLLLDPPERGNVVVRAEQDARLRRAGLRGQIGLPFRQLVPLVGEPPRHVRGVAVAHGALQHRQREPVDLQEQDPRRVCLDLLARAPRDPLDHTQRVGVVVVRPEHDVEHDRDGRGDERDSERRPEGVDRQVAVRDPIGGEEHQGIGDQNEQQADDQHQRQPESCDQRRQDRVENRDHRSGHEGPPEALHLGAGQDPGGDEQRHGRDHPGDREANQPDVRALWAPDGLLAVTRRRRRAGVAAGARGAVTHRRVPTRSTLRGAVA